ncbi:MAG: hypothetical protein PHI12_11880 [Dehalococcoidales bacterium]|nr:hypothetical protein [Dehalococcoidales bacterium]
MTIKAKTKTCAHRWVVSLIGLDTSEVLCLKCRVRHDVPMDKAAVTAYRRYLKGVHKETTVLHRTWHTLERKFKDVETEKWKLSNRELMDTIEHWAKRRKDVHILTVDDSYFASSFLVLVEHKTAHQFMGVTALFIPQCAPGKPTEFFLYPCHAAPLYRLLRGQKTWRNDSVKAMMEDKPLPEYRAAQKEVLRLFRAPKGKKS